MTKKISFLRYNYSSIIFTFSMVTGSIGLDCSPPPLVDTSASAMASTTSSPSVTFPNIT